MRHRHHVGVEVVHHPQRPREHDPDDDDGKDERGQRPAALGLGRHVEEEDHVDHDLHHREAHDDRAGRACAERHRHHQPEGDGGQDHREDEADDIVAHRRVRHLDLVMTVLGVGIGTHRSTPIR